MTPSTPNSDTLIALQLEGAAALIGTAFNAFKTFKPILEQYEREKALFDVVGPIVNPTLYRQAQSEPWREEIVGRSFRAALVFIREMEEVMRAADATRPANENKG